MKCLITGSRGQLGRALARRMPDAAAVDVDSLDITDAKAVLDFCSAHAIDTIVNCAAYTAVDQAEDDAEDARRVNVLGPRHLAATGARLLHISTDYVFDGSGDRPYRPEDATRPASVYGRTKLDGEAEALGGAENAIVIRTAWLYDAEGRNFVNTMRRLGAERESVGVVSDQYGTPTYAGDLADAIMHILPRWKRAHRGIYHYTNEGACSWYDFAVEVMAASALPCRVDPIPTSSYRTRAARPGYSVLDKTKIRETFGLSIPHWKESLRACLAGR